MVPCDRNTSHCNAKRRANGGRNHTHPLELEFPQVDYDDYKTAAQLRKELTRIGVSPSTGVYLHPGGPDGDEGRVLTLEEREGILGRRLANHHRLEFNVQEARRSQRARKFWLPKQRNRMLAAQAIETANALRKAVAANNTELMVTLVKRGAPPETETKGGLTACIRAVLNSDKSCLRQLVEAGADINYASQRTGYSALAWACRRGDLVMCHSVLESEGVAPAFEGPTGITPIMAAAAAGQKEPCNIVSEWVAEHGVAGTLETERLVNYQNKQGDTALHFAARARQLLLCKHLLFMGCKKKTKNKAGRTAAFEARDLGFTELANWLEATKVEGKKSSESQSDRTAERKARVAEGKMLRCLQKGLLRGQEDEMSSKDDDGNGRPGSRGKLGSRRRRRTGSRGSSRERKGETHPDDDSRPQTSHEALALIKREMDEEEARTMALAKANEQNEAALIEIRKLADTRQSLVAQEGDQPVPLPISLDLIMKEGVAPNFETEQGTTALLSAAYAGQAYAVRMLISEGCQVNYQNRNGRTPLMAAAAGGNVRCVIELLRAEANLEITDNEGKTAGQYAAEASMFNIAQLLVNYSSVGISRALEVFMSTDAAMNKKEALMVQYGCTPGEVGGDGDDPDSHLWRLPPLDPRANPIMDDLRREKKREAQRLAEREEARRKAMEERQAIEDAEKEKERQAALAAKALEPPLETPPVTMFVQVIKARNLLAMDKGGTSDPYATVELVNVDTGKAYKGASGDKKPFKTKTKTIKKTLHPNWEESGEDEVAWEDIMKDRASLRDVALQATVFDADLLTSTCLGGMTVKLTDLDEAVLKGEHFVDTWFGLEKVKKMKQDTTGEIQIRLRIEGGDSKDDWADGSIDVGGKVSASNADSSRASSSDASSSRPQSGASDSRPESKGLQRTAVFTASEAAVALATASEKEVSLEAIDSGDGISAVRAAYFAEAKIKNEKNEDENKDEVDQEDEFDDDKTREATPSIDDFLASFQMNDPEWLQEHNSFVADRKAWQRRQTEIRNQAAADIRALENSNLSEDESVRYWQLLERDAKRKEAALMALELKRNPPKAHEVMDQLVPLQTKQDSEMETMQRIDRSGEISEEEMNQMMWLKALGFAKRRIAARLNAAEDAYLKRQQAALEQRRTIKDLSDVSKAAVARQKLLDQTNAASIEVQKLVKLVVGRGGKDSREESALVLSDGLELWKDRMEEVKRRWIQEDELPAEEAAAKKHPDLFVRPPEMDYASFLIGQRKYDEAEGLLRDVMDTQEKAGMRYSAEKGAKFAVGLCHRGLAAIDEARNRLHDALENRMISLELMSPSMEATHPEMRVAVDLIAGTHMLLKQWDFAVQLYQSIADQLEGSHAEDRLKMIEHMRRRASKVTTHRDRAEMAQEDADSRRTEAFFRDPGLLQAQRLGRTEDHLAALLGEAYRVCVVARKDFKKRVNQRGGALPTCVGFWLAAEDFRHTDPKDAGFAYACKRIFKAYIRPPAKLPMLTQGVRKDIEDAINDPQENMYAAAQKLVLKVLFTSVFNSSKQPWIMSPAGRLWKTSREIALDLRRDNAIRKLQTKIRADQAEVCCLLVYDFCLVSRKE